MRYRGQVLWFFLFISCVFFGLILPRRVFASGEFKSSYAVLYEIDNKGETQVVQKIKLVNQKTNYYPTEFEISLGKIKVFDVKAFDGKGSLKTSLGRKGDTTFVKVYFIDKVVGLGKTLEWTLYYTTSDVVETNGLVKEVDLPKLELDSSISDYNLTVKVPPSFGQPLFIKPIYKSSLVFTKKDLTQGQVALAFGDTQILNFNLKYHLKNHKIIPGIYEIAIPPDTPYQKVYLSRLDPAPLTVEEDSDGNWLAKYSLSPQEEKNITATGSVNLFLRPSKNDGIGIEQTFSNNYLKPQNYWEVDNDKIKQLASELRTPEKIYQYVVKSLTYNYSRVSDLPQRLGALYIISNPTKAICTEFTDLFIALARAAGISAREVNGYALTNNSQLKPLSLQKDVLHSWPEYYDSGKKIWIQVDPTWENTTNGIDFFHTFDLNHFAFIRRGTNSEYPIPAGAYKAANNSAKDIEITFGKKQDLVNKNIVELKIIAPDFIYSGLDQEGSIVINNLGQTAVSQDEVTLSVSNGVLLRKQPQDNKIIPPFGKKEIRFGFKSNSFYANKKLTIAASYGTINVSKVLTTRTLSTIYYLPLFGIVLLISLGILIYYLYQWKKLS